jgi:outer membrane protein assembly factor BamB
LLPLALGGFAAGTARADSVAYQMNVAHNGAQSGTGIAPPLKARWSVDLAGTTSYPIIANGRVFVATREAGTLGATAVRAFSSADGSLVWGPVAVGGDSGAALALDGGHLFCADGRGTVRALRTADGVQVWSRTLNSWGDAPPIAANGRVFVGVGGTMFCLNGETGATIWSRSDPNGYDGAPALDASGLYVPHGYPETFKLNAETGALLWQAGRLSSGASSYGHTLVLHNNKLYTRDYPETVIDPATGAYIGTLQLQTAPVFVQTATGGEVVATVTNPISRSGDGVLRGLDPTSGAERWKFTGDRALYCAPVALDGVLYATSTNGNIYAVNPTTGAALWSNTLGAGVSVPNTDEHNTSLHLFGLSAGDGLLVVPARNKLIALQKYVGPDAQPPALSIQNVADGGLVRTLGTLGGVATDDAEGIASISLRLTRAEPWDNSTRVFNGTSWGPYDATLQPTLSGGRWSYSNSALEQNLSTGQYTIRISATDRIGRTSTVTSNFRVDTTPPTADLAQPNGATYSLSQLSGPITDEGGSVAAGMQITLRRDTGCTTSTSGMCSEYWDGAAWIAASSAAPPRVNAIVDRPNWYYWAPSTTPMGNVEGRYTVQMWPRDQLGNEINPWGFGPPTRSFVVDTTAPTATIDSPVMNASVRSLPVATGTAADTRAGIAKVEVSLYANGRGFWNGTAWGAPNTVFLPAVVTPSTSAATSVTWRFDALPTGANAADGVYYYGARAVDKAGNTFWIPSNLHPRITLDSTAPRTTAEMFAAGGPPANAAGWYRSDVDVFLRSNEAGTVWAKVDGGAAQVAPQPLRISGDGEHSLEFWSVGTAGNEEAHRIIAVKIDRAVPTASFAAPTRDSLSNAWNTWSGATGDALSGPAEVRAGLRRARDGAWWNGAAWAPDRALLAAELNGNAWSFVPFSPGAAAAQEDGRYSAVLEARDQAGNVRVLDLAESIPFTVDATAPVIRELERSDPANANGWNNTPVTVHFDASDASGIKSLSPESPLRLEGEGEAVSREVTAEDNAGNVAKKTFSARIDVTKPTTVARVAGEKSSNGTFTGAAKVNLVGSDALSGIESTFYRVDGVAEWTLYSGEFAVEGEGPHRVEFGSVDKAGNSELPQVLEIRIDTTPPVTTLALQGTAGQNGWHTSEVQAALSSSEAGAASVRVNGGEVFLYRGPFVLRDEGTHTIEFWSVDAAGNREAMQTATVKIDLNNPALVWKPLSPAAPASGWHTGPVQVLGEATDAASGVDSITPTLPLQFTQEGAAQSKSVTVSDKAGRAASFNSPALNIDLSAPVTSATVTATAGNNGWVRSNASVTLQGSDALSGVAGTTYKLDAGFDSPVTGTIAVSGDGRHTLSFFSRDTAGHTEARQTREVNIDSGAPTLLATATPSIIKSGTGMVSVVVSGTARDFFSGLDAAGATFTVADEYSRVQPEGSYTVGVDGTYSFSVSLDKARDKTDRDGRLYRITVRSLDQAGNEAIVVATVTVR